MIDAAKAIMIITSFLITTITYMVDHWVQQATSILSLNFPYQVALYSSQPVFSYSSSPINNVPMKTELNMGIYEVEFSNQISAPVGK